MRPEGRPVQPVMDPMRRDLARLRPRPAAPHGRTSDGLKSFEISLSLPVLSLPKRSKLTHRRGIIITAVAAVIVTGLAFGWFRHEHKLAPVVVSGTTQPQLHHGTPGFPTVLPAGKSIASLGGWVQISPPGRSAVYAYTDRIGQVLVDVSEQPLPASFKGDPDAAVAQLAQASSATQKFSAGTATAYLGSSADGSQSVFLTQSGLLILAKSTALIPVEQWVAYLSSLR